MEINSEGLKLIKQFEGARYEWYPDPAHGWKVPTVGYGHTDSAGSPYYKDTKNKKFTQAEIETILLNDLRVEVYPAIKKYVKVSLNSNEFSALASFIFNLGPGNFSKSTLLKKLNAGDRKGAADEFLKWVNANGKPLEGLKRRRKAERELFLKPGLNIQKPVIAEPVIKTPVVEDKTEAGEGWFVTLMKVLSALLRK